MTITAQVRFEHRSAMPEDVYTNTFHFIGDPATAPFATLTTAITEFYNIAGGGAVNPLSFYMSEVIDRSVPVDIRFYDTTAAGPAGDPVATGSFTLGNPGVTTVLPGEVSCVVSFHSQPLSSSANNIRGRVYIGALTGGVISKDAVTSRPGVTPGLIQAGVGASAGLKAFTEVNAPLHVWAVRRELAGVVTANVVNGGFVDDAFDTQRRRGLAATTRNTWTG